MTTTHLALPSDKPDERANEVERQQHRAAQLVIHDEHSAGLGLLYIREMRDFYDRLEEFRTAEVAPLNARVKEINDDYRPYKDKLARECTAMDQRIGDYRAQEKRILQEAQRQAIEDAARVNAEADAKAAELRRQAEEAKEQNVELETTARALQSDLSNLQTQKAIARATDEQDELLTLEAAETRLRDRLVSIAPDVHAVELEAKAQEAELAAVSVAPVVVPQQTKTVEVIGGKKMGFQTVKDPVLPAGLTWEGKYYGDDPRVKDWPDAVFQVEMKRVRKLATNGVAIPGITVVERETTRRR